MTRSRRKVYLQYATSPLMFAFFTFGALAQVPARATQADTANVVEKLRAGNAAEALALTQTELGKFPRDCRLLSLQGVALSALNRQHDALGMYEQTLKVCAAYLPALEGAAQIEYAANDSAAIAKLNQILALQPQDPTSHAMLASMLSRQGECNAAIPHFQASQSMFTVKPELLLAYSICLARTERWSEAVSALAELSREHPSDDATCNLAFAEERAGHVQSALATLAPLINQASSERALLLGSSFAEDAGDTPRAVNLLREAILLQPENVDNYLAFARLADAHKSFQVGIDMINAGLTRRPNVATLYVARGVLHVQLSQIAEAQADFEHAHELDPQLSFAMDAVGILQTQQHENAASLALFRQQAKLHPQDALLQYLLAEALSESSGNSEEAIRAAKGACILEPSYQPARDLLATLYLRANRPDLAVEQANLALAQDPKDSVALYTEIRAKHKLGKDAEVPALVKRLEMAKEDDLARSQQLSRYIFTER